MVLYGMDGLYVRVYVLIFVIVMAVSPATVMAALAMGVGVMVLLLELMIRGQRGASASYLGRCRSGPARFWCKLLKRHKGTLYAGAPTNLPARNRRAPPRIEEHHGLAQNDCTPIPGGRTAGSEQNSKP